jgi:hypothetical protein
MAIAATIYTCSMLAFARLRKRFAFVLNDARRLGRSVAEPKEIGDSCRQKQYSLPSSSRRLSLCPLPAGWARVELVVLSFLPWSQRR